MFFKGVEEKQDLLKRTQKKKENQDLLQKIEKKKKRQIMISQRNEKNKESKEGLFGNLCD